MPRVLIVDDDNTLCQLLRKVFSELHFEVDTANDGASGLELAVEKIPDIAIVDVNMPGVNGYDVCSRLKSQAATRQIPILMLTGISHLPAAMKAMASGANDYITKPFLIEEVVARVQALMRRSH